MKWNSKHGTSKQRDGLCEEQELAFSDFISEANVSSSKKRNDRSELIRECIFRSGFNTILELAVVGETYHSYKLQRSFKKI